MLGFASSKGIGLNPIATRDALAAIGMGQRPMA